MPLQMNQVTVFPTQNMTEMTPVTPISNMDSIPTATERDRGIMNKFDEIY